MPWRNRINHQYFATPIMEAAKKSFSNGCAIKVLTPPPLYLRIPPEYLFFYNVAFVKLQLAKKMLREKKKKRRKKKKCCKARDLSNSSAERSKVSQREASKISYFLMALSLRKGVKKGRPLREKRHFFAASRTVMVDGNAEQKTGNRLNLPTFNSCSFEIL